MSNFGAVQTSNLSYTGTDGSPVEPPTKTTNSPYQTLSEGFVDVPDGTLGAATIDIPFDGITDATFGWIKNETGQDLDIAVNGGTSVDSVPGDGERSWAHPSTTSTPISSYSLTTTGVQSGDGKIRYRIMGNPT